MSEIQDLFNTTIPALIEKNPDGAKTIGAIFYLDITGDGGGQWTINLKDTPACVPGDAGTSECQITITAEDWTALRNAGPMIQQQAMQLFFSGKLKVGGNQALAMKLGKLFDLAKSGDA
jgi:putative sterol carrier protein